MNIEEIECVLVPFGLFEISFDFKYPVSSSSGFSINFETSKLLGNITIWPNLYMDVLIVELEDGTEVFNKTFVHQTFKNLLDCIKNVMENVMENVI